MTPLDDASAGGGGLQETPYDLLGIGFGPSNLALAIALEEAAAEQGRGLRYRFLEKQERFTWHGGMLLPDSGMQISFIKDLVSLRDPTSPFTFLNYLHQKGRLEAFINQKTFFPSRIEFNDYLRWAAARFAERCSYGEEVIGVEPEVAGRIAGERVDCLRVISRSPGGGERLYRTRNLAIAVGGTPHLPPVFADLAEDPRVFHSSSYLTRIAELGLEARPGARVAVLGGGQSAAEILLDLHGRFPGLAIDLLYRGQALKPADDTPFVNEIFDPGFTSFVFEQPEQRRHQLIHEFRNTNYAVVDVALIEQIYGLLYRQRVRGEARLALHGRSEVREARADPGGIAVTVSDGFTGSVWSGAYAAVVLATGYERAAHSRLLAPLAPYLEGLAVDRCYRLRTRPDFAPRIHLQGYSEASHGLSDTLLSVLAIRSKEIADALLERSPAATGNCAAGR